MAKLAQATSTAIAWLLIMPDAVALLPNATSVLSWFLKLLGLWISALVLWFVSFLGILHLVRLFGNGVSIDDQGIKLWRFAKTIPWSRIQAVAVEPQIAFSKLFSLHPIATRLTLFEQPARKSKLFDLRLVAHNIPSFLFAPADFESLVQTISQHAMGTAADCPNVLLVPAPALKKLRITHRLQAGQRVLVTGLILLGLSTLLGRKAYVNYVYNSGNKELSNQRYAMAKKDYELALRFEPAFAAAWNNLAIAEFDLGDSTAADRHWRKALFYKPDFVEAKVSLAYLLIHQKEFQPAKEFLESALNIAPLNPAALINRSDWNFRLGHYHETLDDARMVLMQAKAEDPVRTKAYCLMAQAKLKLGQPKEALALLSRAGPNGSEHTSEFGYVADRLIVESQYKAAIGESDQAVELARRATEIAPRSNDAKENFIEINKLVRIRAGGLGRVSFAERPPKKR
jgi:tetratricopeptide (TPR) repeat protein